MPVEVLCSKCGAVVYTMRILKAVRDVVKTNNKCPSCGQPLSSYDFTVSVDKL
ncbi:MAG: hypothetical protein ACE5JV_00010 [Nitrososphaerales archaeon]